MRRSLSARVFAALFAPWFAFVVAEPVPMHDCPVHSAHAAAAGPTDVASDEMVMAHDGMEHAAMEHAVPAHQHGAPGHAGHHQCCCLGMSCASVIVALVPAPLPLGWLPAEIARVSAWPHADPLGAATADHVLPFANGPPAPRV
jgi:hypothetical protein